VPLAILFEGGLGVAAMALGWLVGQPPAATFRWSFTDLAIGLFASLPLLVALMLMTRSRVAALVRLRQFVDATVVPLFARCGMLELAVISVFAGVGEEMLFRGVIQVALARWLSVAAGVAGASLLFGMAHPLTLAYAVITTLAGLYLGFLFLASDNLLVPIVTHAAYDFLALVYLLRRHRPPAAALLD
jgi:hypothetical protein